MTKPRWTWDTWQEEAIDYKGHITIRCGRQTGKSTTVSKRKSNQMLEYTGSKSLLIAPAQRQSSELFIKTYGWLEIKHQELLEKAGGFEPNARFSMKRNMEKRRLFEHRYGLYNEQPTKTTIVLKEEFDNEPGKNNIGSICYSLPAGKTGVYLRTFALDFLDIDEAAYVPGVVYNTLKPMLAVSEKERGLGWETLLSTPFGKGGFFYDSHHSDRYKKIHVTSEQCIRISKKFLAEERKRMPKWMYKQEYLAEFIDDYRQYYSTELIKKCMTIIAWEQKDRLANSSFYCGLDFAAMGGDENAWVIVELAGKKLRVPKCLTTERISSIDTINQTVKLDDVWGFKKLFTDDGGLGSPITDALQEKLGKKVFGINNAKRKLEIQGEERKQGIMKEDLYQNLLLLMETGRIEMINDMDLMKSLKSITFEHTDNRKIKIFGKHSHLTEALVRACWCIKERGLNLYCY